MRTIVVTGASSGIGLETARALAADGDRVVMVVRNHAKGQAAIEDIRTGVPGAQIDLVLADLYVQAEVRRAAAEIRALVPQIDVLVNNAGLIHDRRELTSDGIERTFALNQLAPFLLTYELRDHVREGGRVITVSSEGHRIGSLGTFPWEDIATRESWPIATVVYGASKLCNIWFARESARRFAERRITSNALHPGTVASNFGASGSALYRVGMKVVGRLLLTPAQGAATSIYLARSPDVEGVTGEYFVRSKVATPSRAARDDDSARRLWELSEQLTGVVWR